MTNMSYTITNTSMNGPSSNGLSFLSWTSETGDVGKFLQLCTTTQQNKPTTDGAFQLYNKGSQLNIKNYGVSTQDTLGFVTPGAQASSTGLGSKLEVSTGGSWPYDLKLEYNTDET